MVSKWMIVISAMALTAGAWADDVSSKSSGDAEVKKLLVLMDKDKSGKVSREEFMNFFSEEFDRLDVNKDGELDVAELTQLRVRPGKHPGGAGSK